LVGFSLAFVVLNVYSRIARPRGFENAVATTALTGHPEVVFTDLFQITKSNPFGIRFHLIDDFRNASRETIVSLLILLAKGDSAHNADVRWRRAWNGFLRTNAEGIRRSIEIDQSSLTPLIIEIDQSSLTPLILLITPTCKGTAESVS
jgi:hypothetical protein